MMLRQRPQRFTFALLLVLSTFYPACSGDQHNQNGNTSSGTATTSDQKASGPPLYEGFFDIADCDLIHGWVWNQNDPNTPLEVEIYDGSTLLATVKADEERRDLIAAGKGKGKYAYSYIPSPALRDGKPHTIRVKIAGADYELGNSPKTITCFFN